MTGFRPFPRVIAEIIAGYCAEIKLLDWIHPAPLLRSPNLYANPLAHWADMLDLSHIDPRDPNYGNKLLCPTNVGFGCSCTYHATTNPALKDFIKAAHSSFMLPPTSKYPGPLEILGHMAYVWCVENVGMLHAPGINIDAINKSRGKLTSDWIDGAEAHMNPANIIDIKYLLTLNCVNYEMLSSNPHPWVMEHLHDNWDKIHIDFFAENPGIFHMSTNKKLVKILSRSV